MFQKQTNISYLINFLYKGTKVQAKKFNMKRRHLRQKLSKHEICKKNSISEVEAKC